jgi:hypothetical protein
MYREETFYCDRFECRRSHESKIHFCVVYSRDWGPLSVAVTALIAKRNPLVVLVFHFVCREIIREGGWCSNKSNPFGCVPSPFARKSHAYQLDAY